MMRRFQQSESQSTTVEAGSLGRRRTAMQSGAWREHCILWRPGGCSSVSREMETGIPVNISCLHESCISMRKAYV